MSETTPLVRTGRNGGGNGNGNAYYFQNTDKREAELSQYHSVRDNDGGQTVEQIPSGSTLQDFEPRSIGAVPKEKSNRGLGLFVKLFKRSSTNKEQPSRDSSNSNKIGSMVKPRKAPIKVEPKVFFANERTFLAWMHISIILAGASIAILAFADYTNLGKQIYGLIMLPVAIAFIVYAMYQYVRRAYMIRNKLPGPYDDTVGPVVLGIMLMISITAQFAIKLMEISR